MQTEIRTSYPILSHTHCVIHALADYMMTTHHTFINVLIAKCHWDCPYPWQRQPMRSIQLQIMLVDAAWSANRKAHVTDFLLFVWGGVRIGPKRSVVSVHIDLIKNTTEHWNKIINVKYTKPKQYCVAQTLTRKQTPTNQKWNPGYLSMILNQRQLTTPASDWEPY